MSQKNLLEYISQPLSVEDSPASRSVVPENKKEKQMTDTCGQKCCGLSESLNPDGLWGRMSRELLKLLSMTSSIALKRKDTPRKHTVIQFRLSVPVINGNESLLLPTITTQEVEHPEMEISETGRRINKNWKDSHSIGLADRITMLRTPGMKEPGVLVTRLQTKTGEPAKIGERAYDKQTGRLAQVGLTQQIAMLPTCTARDYKGGTKEKVAQGNPKRILDCEMQVHGLKLQPAFAEWMMGFPEGWTALSASEMPLSRSKSIRSSKRLQK